MIETIENHTYDLIAAVQFAGGVHQFERGYPGTISLMVKSPSELPFEPRFITPALRSLSPPFFVIHLSDVVYQHEAFNHLRLMKDALVLTKLAIRQFKFLYKLMRYRHEKSEVVLLPYALAYLADGLTREEVVKMQSGGDVMIWQHGGLSTIHATGLARKRFIHRFGELDFENEFFYRDYDSSYGE